MINQIKAFFDLKKEIPDAVGYSKYGPVKFLLPIEFKNELPHISSEKLDGLTTSGITIYNYSSKTQKNIRVLYSGNFPYMPRARFLRRDIDPKFENKINDKELLILEIPPNDTININIFNPDEKFKFEDVLIGENVVTTFMQALADRKKYPSSPWRKYLYMLLFFVFVFSGYLGYEIYRLHILNEDANFISDARKATEIDDGKIKCLPYVFLNNINNEKNLERKIEQINPWFKQFIIKINKIKSLDELKNKNKIIFCDLIKE